MNWLTFLVSSLAVFRLSELIAYDSGPWGVFERFRNWLKPHENLYGLVSCIYCLGVHFSAWITLVLVLAGGVQMKHSLVYCFGLAGAAVAIGRTVRPR